MSIKNATVREKLSIYVTPIPVFGIMVLMPYSVWYLTNNQILTFIVGGVCSFISIGLLMGLLEYIREIDTKRR